MVPLDHTRTASGRAKTPVSGRLQSGDTLVWSAASRPGMAVLSSQFNDLTMPRPAQGSRNEDSHRQQQSAAGRGDFRVAGPAAGAGQHPPLLRHRRSSSRSWRTCAARTCSSSSRRQLPGQRQSDGAADHHRCAAPQLGAAHHGGDALLRLCPPGPQDRPAHADLGQAGGQPDHHAPAPTAC